MIGSPPPHGGQVRQVTDLLGIAPVALLDFSANLNPDGPPAAVLSRLRASFDDSTVITNYPDLDELEVRRSLAEYAGISTESISVANGFVPLLDSVLRPLPIQRCVVPVPAFVEYRRTLQQSRIEVVPYILTTGSGFACHTEDLFRDSCDAILLENPQNPSGVLYSRDTMLRIVEEARNREIYVFLDEAFVDYCPEASLIREVVRYPNLIVFRSLTKFFGMAGLRIAYAATNAELCGRVQESIAPWSVTSLASVAACAAVRDIDYAPQAIGRNNSRRDQMRAAIEALGIHVYPSAANFLLLRLPKSIDSRQVWEQMIRRHRILLRHCANYEGLGDGHLRVAVRTEAENDRLIAALRCEIGNEQ